MGRAVHSISRDGDLDAFESFARWFIDFNERNDFPWMLAGASWLGLTIFWRGDWEAARAHVAQSVDFQRQMRYPHTAWSVWSNAVMVAAYTGDGDVAAPLDERAPELPRPGQRNSSGAWGLAFKTIEAAALIGQRQRAASLYPLVLEALDTSTVADFQSIDLLEKAAGTAAGAAGEWDVAEEHFCTALRQAEELPHLIAQPEVRRWYARMLIDRDGSGDRDHARTLLGEAMTRYDERGMPKHVQMAVDLRAAIT